MKYTLNDFNGAGYIFNPATKTIILSGMDILDKTNIFSIINATDNKVIMQLNNPLLGIETLTNNIITLVYDTSSMNSNDELVFIFDIEIKQTELGPESMSRFRRLLKAISSLAIKDSNGRQRVNVETGSVAISNSPAVTISSGAVTTVGALSNLTNIGGRSADMQYQTQSRNTYANNTRSHLHYT